MNRDAEIQCKVCERDFIWNGYHNFADQNVTCPHCHTIWKTRAQYDGSGKVCKSLELYDPRITRIAIDHDENKKGIALVQEAVTFAAGLLAMLKNYPDLDDRDRFLFSKIQMKLEAAERILYGR